MRPVWIWMLPLAVTLVLVLAGFTTPAAARSGQAGAPPPIIAQQSQTPPAAATTQAAPEQAFVVHAASLHLFAIEAGRLARQRAHNETLRAFAALMIAEHEDLAARLRQTAAALQIEAPVAPDARQRARLEALQQTPPGDGFDRAYAAAQGDALADALKLKQDFAAGDGHAALRELAEAALPLIERQRDRLQALQQ